MKTRNEVVYPISLDYRSSWGEWEAVREFVTNAIDSGGRVELSYNKSNRTMVISDSGRGFELHHLLIGEGESDGQETIGKFHEGMKIAIVTLLRIGCKVRIQSNGIDITPSTAEMFGKKVLKLKYIKDIKSVNGTVVTIREIKKDYKDKFLRLDSQDRMDRIIFLNEGRLYIKGVYVRDIESLFSYDLNMERANPNTGEPEWYEVRKKVSRLIANTSSKKVITRIAEVVKDKNWQGNLEFDSWDYISHERVPLWKSTFKKVYGNRVVLYSNATAAKLVEYDRKGIVIDGVPSVVVNALHKDIDVVRLPKGGKKKNVSRKDLNKEEKKILRRVKGVFEKAYSVKINVSIKKLEPGVDGLAKYREFVYIDKSRLVSYEKCFATFLHEFIHWYYGFDDLSEEFINTMSRVSSYLFLNVPSFVRIKLQK